MQMTDIPPQVLRTMGFWAHLIAPVSGTDRFLWKCYEEASGGTWTDRVLDEGDDAFPMNSFVPPRFPWIVPLRLYGSDLIIGMRNPNHIVAELVAREQGGSYAWREQSRANHEFMDAEDLPHSNAYEPNGLMPQLPYRTLLTSRYIPSEYMFYLGKY